jgi:thiamine pyrophosphokinase
MTSPDPMTSPARSRTVRHALVLAGGDAPTRAGLEAAWPGWDAEADYVVAADGGARLAPELGLTIDEWVGDGDSVGEVELLRLREAGVPISLASGDKDETDTELGLLAAVAAGASRVTILGAFGGPRIDHALANIHLLAHEAARGVAVEILDPAARMRLLDAAADGGQVAAMDLGGRVGDIVSLIPLTDALGVTTTDLRYPLVDEPLPVGPARGLSNVRESEAARVTLRHGRLLVIEVPATLPE